MSSSARFVSMALLVALVNLGMANAQGTSGCTATIVSLAPCLQYTTGSVPQPSSACCTSLAGVVSSKPQCLCTLVDGDGGSQFNVNKTLALQLPKACNVETPPISDCKAVANATVAPAAAPSTSKAAPPTTSEAAAPTPTAPKDTPTPTSKGGSNAPSPSNNSNQSVKIAGSLFLLFAAFAASYGSIILEM